MNTPSRNVIFNQEPSGNVVGSLIMPDGSPLGVIAIRSDGKVKVQQTITESQTMALIEDFKFAQREGAINQIES